MKQPVAVTLDGLAGWTIREMTPADRPLVVEGFARLSAETRRRRYLGLRTSLGEAELDAIVGLVPGVPAALAAVNAGGALLGVARLGLDPEEPGVAHVGIVVGDPWQGRGIGRSLLRALVARAVRAGLRRLRATAAADNAPVLHLLRRAGAGMPRPVGGGVVETDIALPPGCRQPGPAEPFAGRQPACSAAAT